MTILNDLSNTVEHVSTNEMKSNLFGWFNKDGVKVLNRLFCSINSVFRCTVKPQQRLIILQLIPMLINVCTSELTHLSQLRIDSLFQFRNSFLNI